MLPDRRKFLGSALALLAATQAANVQGARRVQVALLGDSVFDNAAYVKPNTDVPTRRRRRLGDGDVVRLAKVLYPCSSNDLSRELINNP